MARLNQIQNKLRELGDAAFQKFADAFLLKKGYEQINSIGSVIGADKVRKGTPDTLIPLRNGKYVFAEHTAQQSRVYAKLYEDLTKCLDESQTGILTSKIAEVVFCYSAELEPSEIDELREKCQRNQVNLNLFGNSRISNDVLFKYPGLAKEFLEIDVDTGQIVDLDEFVAVNNKSVLATPLDTTFHFRNTELEQIVHTLDASDLVIIGGQAGVGKTRFAIECCREFSKSHTGFQVNCIFNRGPDLFADIQIHFSDPGHYVILVDDANRINRFDYVLQLLHNQNADRKVKLIATTRDYASEKVREAARPYGGGSYFELRRFETDQIKQLVKDECEITNDLYLERIAAIAKGNPRLALMAGRVAKRENRLDSITDVSGLYDEYFSSIRKDIEDLGDSAIVSVAGLVAFFRSVDRSNPDVMSTIETTFEISQEGFWTHALRLHEAEVLDLWENDVVRFSDQVLATYLFYLCFFKQRTLSFSTLLQKFFPYQRQRLYDSFYPVLNVFYSNRLLETVRQEVDKVWKTLQTSRDEDSVLSLCEAFWFVKETDVLLHIRNLIGKLEPETLPQMDEGEVKPDSNISSPSILSILKEFKQANESNARIAVSLILDYLQKRPSDLPQVYYLLTESFGFQRRSHLYDFYVQRAVVDSLRERAHDGTNVLLTKLQFLVNRHFLKTRFQTTEPGDKRVINLFTFDLPASPALYELRKQIWQNLFKLYEIPNFRYEVLDTLNSYSSSGYEVSVDKIVEMESNDLLSFISLNLDPAIYSHCVAVQDLLDLFSERNVQYDQTLRSRFRNRAFSLTKAIIDDLDEGRTLGYVEYKKAKLKRLGDLFKGYALLDYQQFISDCVQIKGELHAPHEQYQLEEGVCEVLVSLYERDPVLYSSVFRYYLEAGDQLALNPIVPVDKFLRAVGARKALLFLKLPSLNVNRTRWLFAYYQVLEPEHVRKKHADQICKLYRKAMREDVPFHVDYLLKYLAVDNAVFIRVTKIILSKIRRDRLWPSALHILFNPNSESNKRILELYRDNYDLLERAFFCILEIESQTDHDGTTINKLIDLDVNFIVRFIDWMYSRRERLSRLDDFREYLFLWRRDDYSKIMTLVLHSVLRNEMHRKTYFGSYVASFFKTGEKITDEVLIAERQNKFLEEIIVEQSKNTNLMKLVFAAASTFQADRRRNLLATFVNWNKNFHDFKLLSLEPTSGVSWTSELSRLKGSIDFLESLLPILNTVDLLEHKQLIENGIVNLRGYMESEKKRDFMGDDC